jgi:hypothetical protein
MRAVAACALAVAAAAAPPRVTSAAPLPGSGSVTYAVPCGATYATAGLPAGGAGCVPTAAGGHTRGCLRHVEDAFVSPEEVARLLAMLAPGFARSHATAGPTILDVNSGFLRDSATGVVNIYQPGRGAPGRAPAPAVTFAADDLALYRSVFDRILNRVRDLFNLTTLFFTAPTFVTRIIGAPDWQPTDAHDEYFHGHVDMANTPHYHYSGLLYLASHASVDGGEEEGGGADEGVPGPRFHGGEFAFLAARNASSTPPAGAAAAPPDAGAADAPAAEEHVVLPRAGRLLAFSAGHENEHAVRRVASGTRFVFSMWFTCDPRREFATFLDNRAHATGGGGGGGGGGGDSEGDERQRASRKKKRRPAAPSRRRDAGANRIDGAGEL